MLAFTRFIVLKKDHFKSKELDMRIESHLMPLSIANEIDAWNLINRQVTGALKGFPQDIEQDYLILDRDSAAQDGDPDLEELS